MITTLTLPITIEEYEALPGEQTDRMEVVRGILTPRDPLDADGNVIFPGALHGVVHGEVAAILYTWAKANDAGRVLLSLDCVLRDTPLTMRIPDVSFLSKHTLSGVRLPKGAWHGAPDLAVEVISQGERKQHSEAKVADYLAFGSALVWTVWPDAREVVAHTPDGTTRTYRLGDTLEFPNVLPGFSCRVDDLFAQE